MKKMYRNSIINSCAPKESSSLIILIILLLNAVEFGHIPGLIARYFRIEDFPPEGLSTLSPVLEPLDAIPVAVFASRAAAPAMS